MKRLSVLTMTVITLLFVGATAVLALNLNFWGNSVRAIAPVKGRIEIPVAEVDDGKAHHFKVQADDGVEVTFFVLKSQDGVIRAAVDACDVCFKSGKGYVQDGDYMVCTNCGQRFASNKINVIRGGCNPAPLERSVEGGKLGIAMSDINANSWYCRYKRS
jgi:uncharacterized membrane protein